MRKLMKPTGRIWLTIIFLITSASLTAQGKEADHILEQANKLYQNHQYKSAVKEYQRYLFYSGAQDPEVLVRVAGGLAEMGQYELALQYYEQIYYLTSDPEIKFRSLLPEVSFFIRQKEYDKALISLYSLSASWYDLHPEIIDFLFAICHFGMEDFTKSEEYFMKIVSADSLAVSEIKKIFADEKQFYKPNPQKLSILSLFVPGLGQMISREYKEGLNSLFLLGGVATIAVFVAINYSISQAVISVLPWYQRYLMGGSDKTEKLAEKRRSINRDAIYKELLKVLASNKEAFELSVIGN